MPSALTRGVNSGWSLTATERDPLFTSRRAQLVSWKNGVPCLFVGEFLPIVVLATISDRGWKCHRRRWREVLPRGLRIKASNRNFPWASIKMLASIVSPAWCRACPFRRSTQRAASEWWKTICTSNSWQTSHWLQVSGPDWTLCSITAWISRRTPISIR